MRGRDGQRGFTLLEIIVVVLLIAVSATFVVVNLERDTDTLARFEAERFARLIEQARDESIISGRPYALSVDTDRNSYEFLRYGSEGEWVPVSEDDMFRRREIPGDLNVIFELLGGGSGASDLLVIEGLGEIASYNFLIEGDARVYAVRPGEGRTAAVSDVTPD